MNLEKTEPILKEKTSDLSFFLSNTLNMGGLQES